MIVPITSLIASSSGLEDRSLCRRGSLAGPWMIAAAPLAGATLWLTATGASLLFWSVTGSTGPLDWCRSGTGLLAAATLTMTALVTASLLQWIRERRLQSARVAQPVAAEVAAGGWRLDEGGFTTI